MYRQILSGLILWLVAMACAQAQPLPQSYLSCSDELAAETHSGRGFYTFVWENDIFGGTDRNYTNGNRLTYTSLPQHLDGRHGVLARRLLNARCEDIVLFGVALGHSIFTPEDTRTPKPLPDQHPYAGWLYGEYSLLVGRTQSALVPRTNAGGGIRDIESLTLQLGIVGPAAQGEWVQNNFHRKLGFDEALGWDNQLENEFGVLLSYDRRFQLAHRRLLGDGHDLGIDLVPNFGFSVGNVLTQASGGLTVRFGSKLNMSDLPPRVRPSTPGGGLFQSTPSDPFAWYVFAGVEGRAVAQNLFLDGNSFEDSLSVEKKNFVADFQIGAALRYNNVQLSYTFVTRTEEFETQNKRQQFGSANLTVRF